MVSTYWEPLPQTRAATVEPTSLEVDVIEDSPWDALPLEPGSRAVADKEVRASTGAERECWRQAAHEEVQDSCMRMGAVSIATPADLAQVGGRSGILPMKAVWVRKPDRYKCRGVACGNFAQRNPTEQVWTAQAEVASILSGLRLGQLRGWDACTMDVKSAFMAAKLPSHVKVVLRPPQIWVD